MSDTVNGKGIGTKLGKALLPSGWGNGEIGTVQLKITAWRNCLRYLQDGELPKAFELVNQSLCLPLATVEE